MQTVRISLTITAFFLFASLSGSAFAGIHKCVAADGTTTYTDQPCPVAKTEAKVDSSVSSASHQIELADSCNSLNLRRSHCQRTSTVLDTNFKQYCSAPLINYQMDHQRPQQYNRFRTARERQADAVTNMQQQIAEDYHCETIEQDSWSFLKDNFGKKISEKDASAIEYSIHAVRGGSQPTIGITHVQQSPGPHVTTVVTTTVHTVLTN